MPVHKVCPSCQYQVHIRKLQCPNSGYVFHRSRPRFSKDHTQCRKSVRERVVHKRTLESPQQASKPRQLDKEHAASKRTLESPQQANKRRQLNKEREASKRALESPQLSSVEIGHC